jgi:hypothetical protein
MPRLFAAVLCVLVVLAGAVRAAPAPLPKKEKDNPLLRQVRKTLSTYGYLLHEMRPGQEPGEWTLRFTDAADSKPREIICLSINAEHLGNPKILGILAQLAAVHHDRHRRDNGGDGCLTLTPMQPR